MFLKLNIKSDKNSSIVFEYDDLMKLNPILTLNDYLDLALSMGYKYKILPNPVNRFI